MEIITGEDLKRSHIKNKFMRESLVDKDVVRNSQATEEISVIPSANIILLGGRSIMDKGKKVVFPLMDEIVENNASHNMILGVSGGVRVRHVFSIAHDLGLPTGGLAMLAGGIEEQNARMIYALLAKHRGARVSRERFEELPLFLDGGMIPILVASPPHHYWEMPPVVGIIPEHGPDFGMFMVSEVLGTKSMIFLKDQDGLYTKDPKKNPDAKLIEKISVQELLKMDLQDSLIERSVLEAMLTARHAKKIYIINGTKQGNLTKALRGEDVGTIIYKDEQTTMNNE